MWLTMRSLPAKMPSVYPHYVHDVLWRWCPEEPAKAVLEIMFPFYIPNGPLLEDF